MYKILLMLAMGVALTTAQIPNLGWCPDYVPMADFDMERYLGTWYEQERYFRVMEAGSRCVRTNYTKAVDGRILVASEITGRLSGLKRVLEGQMDLQGKSRLNVKYNTTPFPIEMAYTVLDTDYDTYSVVWSCSGLGPVNTQSAWLMTRERLAPGTVLQKAYGVLDKYKISRTFFVKTDQADCAIAEAAAAAGPDAVDENKVIQTKSAAPVPSAEKTDAVVAEEVVKPAPAAVEPAVVPAAAVPAVSAVVAEEKPHADHPSPVKADHAHHAKPHPKPVH
nr:apolipoprotein D-like protein 2 [Nilaparvata lugens]